MKLQEIIRLSEGNKNNYSQSIENLKPPVFWKDKSIILQQLRRWDLEQLTQLATEIGETEILMKRNSLLRNDIIIKKLIIDLSSKVSSTSS